MTGRRREGFAPGLKATVPNNGWYGKKEMGRIAERVPCNTYIYATINPLPPCGGGLGWGGSFQNIRCLKLHPPPAPSRHGRGRSAKLVMVRGTRNEERGARSEERKAKGKGQKIPDARTGVRGENFLFPEQIIR